MGETNKAQTSENNVSTSTEPQGSTSEQTPSTFTKEQVDSLIQKATRDAKTEVGRLSKLNSNLIQQSKNVIDRVTKHFGDLEELVQDDPAKLTAIRNRKESLDSDIRAETDRERREQELAEIKEYRVGKLAEKYNVDPAIILKYGGESKDSMEELAKSFGERKVAESNTEPQNVQTTQGQRMTSPPDSGKTKGGGGGLTKEQVQKMSPAEQHQRQKEIAQLPF